MLATLFAFLAAAAALGATLLQRQAMQRMRLPELRAGVRVSPNRTAELAIMNGGSGLGVQVGYLLVDGDYKRTGLVEGGFLKAEEEKVIPVRPPSKSEVSVVWACRDIDHNFHVWSHHGGYKRVPRRRVLRKRGTDIREHFRRFYPDVPIPS